MLVVLTPLRQTLCCLCDDCFPVCGVSLAYFSAAIGGERAAGGARGQAGRDGHAGDSPATQRPGEPGRRQSTGHAQSRPQHGHTGKVS